MNQAHQLGIREIFHAGCGVDTLNPESAEIALFLLAVAIGVGETFFPGVLRYGPHVAAAAVISAGQFKYFLSFSARRYVIY